MQEMDRIASDGNRAMESEIAMVEKERMSIHKITLIPSEAL
jgi:hypothetical protein